MNFAIKVIKYVTRPQNLRCLSTKCTTITKPPELNPWIWQINTEINTPKPLSTPITLPSSLIWNPRIVVPNPTKYMELPPLEHQRDVTIEAARLIVIRRRKMKKHKLKKLRKRMKFEWAKLRQRRELKKEKAFQAQLIAQIKEAEKFSAEEYVVEKLRQATEKPLPRFWKGKRLPAFIIREKLGLDKPSTQKNI